MINSHHLKNLQIRKEARAKVEGSQKSYIIFDKKLKSEEDSRNGDICKEVKVWRRQPKMPKIIVLQLWMCSMRIITLNARLFFLFRRTDGLFIQF